MITLLTSHTSRTASTTRPLQGPPLLQAPTQSPHDKEAPVGSSNLAPQCTRRTLSAGTSFRTRNANLQPPVSLETSAKGFHPPWVIPEKLAPIAPMLLASGYGYGQHTALRAAGSGASFCSRNAAPPPPVSFGANTEAMHPLWILRWFAPIAPVKPPNDGNDVRATSLLLRGGCTKGWQQTPERGSYDRARENCRGCYRPFDVCAQTTTYLAWESDGYKYCGDCWNAYLGTSLVVAAMLQPGVHKCGVHTCRKDLSSVPWFALEGDTYCPSCSASFWTITGTFTVESI